MAYQGHVSYGSFAAASDDPTTVAPADRFGEAKVAPASGDAGYAAHLNGYPRSDGQPAGDGHFGAR